MKYSKQLSTNSRIIKDLLTKYKDTFAAFCELLNNSIQAKATRIELTIDYANLASARAPFTKIELTDNGTGVHILLAVEGEPGIRCGGIKESRRRRMRT